MRCFCRRFRRKFAIHRSFFFFLGAVRKSTKFGFLLLFRFLRQQQPQQRTLRFCSFFSQAVNWLPKRMEKEANRSQYCCSVSCAGDAIPVMRYDHVVQWFPRAALNVICKETLHVLIVAAEFRPVTCIPMQKGSQLALIMDPPVFGTHTTSI